MQRYKLFSFLGLLGFLLSCSICFALPVQPKAESDNRVLQVGLIPGEPFVIHDNGEYEGIAVDIWKRIAALNKYKYEFVLLDDNVDKNLLELNKNKLDIIIGPISDSHYRSTIAKLTGPYYINQIGLMVKESEGDYLALIKKYSIKLVSPALLFFILFFFLYVHVYWYYEREHNEEIPKAYGAGIKYAILVHLQRKGFLSVPKTAIGQLVILLWVIVTALMLSSITAIITSTLTTSSIKSEAKIQKLADIDRNTLIAVVEGNKIPNILLEKSRPKLNKVPSTKEAIDLLRKGEVDAVLYDIPLAEYLLYNTTGTQLHNLAVSDLVLQYDLYVFALPENSKLFNAINNSLVALRETGSNRRICEKYLSEKTAESCEF